MNRLKILLVDDNREFLGVAAGFLSGQASSIEIAGMAHSGREAIEMADQLHPDLVLMDLSMPGMNGFEATRQLKSLSSPPRVLIVTLYEGPDFISQARAFGADGFLSKSQFGELLLPAVSALFPLHKHLPPAANGREAETVSAAINPSA